MKTCLPRSAGLLILLLLSVWLPAFAQTPAGTPPAPNTDATWSVNDIPDYLDQIQSFQNQKAELEITVKNLVYVDTIKTDFEDLAVQLADAQTGFGAKRQISSWDLIRAGDFKKDVGHLFDFADKLRKNYSDYLKQTEKISTDLNAHLAMLKKFYELVQKDSSLASHVVTILQAKKNVEDLMMQIRSGRKEYTSIYQDQASLLDEVAAFGEAISGEMEFFRKAQFQKTVPAFFEPSFYTGFTDDLVAELRTAWVDVFHVQWQDFVEHRVPLLHAFGIFFMLWLLIREIRWHFPPKSRTGFAAILMQHPLTVALIGALLMAGLNLERPPLILVLGFWASLTPLVLYLMIQLETNRLARRDFAVLIFIYAALQVVERIGIPLVLYRLFLVVLAGLVAFICARRSRSLLEGAGARMPVQLVLRALVALCIFTIVAESFGYHLFAAYLIHAAVQTAFVIFVLWNVRDIFRRGLAGILQMSSWQRLAFLQRHQELIHRRTRWIVDVVLAGWVIILLTSVWGFYDDFNAALYGFLGFGFSISDRKINLGLILQAIILFSVVRLVAFVVCNVLEDEIYPRRRIGAGSGKSINSLITYSIWLIGALLAFSVLGFDFRQLAIIAGALSVGIGFGLQNIVNNFVAGLILLFERPIRIGDLLDISGQWGTVVKVGLRSTVIRTLLGAEVIVPNSDLITQKVCNLTLSNAEYLVIVPVAVSYDADPERVRALLLEVASQHPAIDPEIPPAVLFLRIGDNAIEFELRAWLRDANARNPVHSDLMFAIFRALREANINIPYPQRTLHLESVSAQAAQVLKG